MARQKLQPALTAEQDAFVRMEANGCTGAEIIKALWNIEPDDPGYHAKECMISRWRKHPLYAETWKDEVQKQCMPMLTMALRKLKKQASTDEQWLGNKAANDLLAFAKGRVFAEDERTVNVQITGLPDIGTPDGESGTED